MKKDRIIKLAVLNGAIMLTNILVFSNAFFKLKIGSGAFATAFGVMVIAMSGLVFFYGNIKILTAKAPPQPPMLKDKEILSLENCAAAVEHYLNNNAQTYAAHLKSVLAQIDRMKKKKRTIREMLLERFSETELSFEKFSTAVEQMERIMILNIRSLLNRINAFDEEEYEQMLESAHSHSEKLLETRRNIYNEYKAFVEKAAGNNEEILLKLDKLILEISKLNDLSVAEIEDMDAMVEIDTLIRDAKWYR
ncbi:MAG: hypothetical protein FWF10_06740 [Clostridiales bacterium]|nr:hypothetical protein [Clostridiales bacterium]